MDTVFYSYDCKVTGASARCMTCILCKHISHYIYDDSNLLPDATHTAARHYDYDTTGRPVFAIAAGNIGSSTHFMSCHPDSETHFYYYGYRYYSAELGRWPNRDPIRERGGINLHGFVGNEPLSRIDPHGDATSSIPIPGEPPFWVPIGPTPPWQPVPTMKCCKDAYNFYDAVDEQAAREAADIEARIGNIGPDGSTGMLRHCIAACRLVRRYGERLGHCIRRGWDWTNERVTPDTDPAKAFDSLFDWHAENMGEDCGRTEKGCIHCCLESLLKAYPLDNAEDPQSSHGPIPQEPTIETRK